MKHQFEDEICKICFIDQGRVDPDQDCSGCSCDHDCRFDRERHDENCEHYDDCKIWAIAPYLQKKISIDVYNRKYGDRRKCACGHMYKFHFDRRDPSISRDICSYCGCGKFEECNDELDD